MFKPQIIKISKENFKVMQPILSVSRFFGLCPIFYEDCGNVYKLQRSLFYGIYSYFLSAVLALATFLSTLPGKSVISNKLAEGGKPQIATVDMISTSTILIFCILATPFKLRALWKICEYFNEIETIFALDKALTYRKKSVYFIWSVLALYTFIYVYDIAWNLKLGKSDSFATFFMEYMLFYLPKYMLISQILLFCHLVYFTKIRLMCLNLDLMKHPLRSISISDQSGVYEVHRLLGLANSQRHIFEVVGVISGTFAFGVVLIMLSCLLHLTISPFFLLNEIEKNGSVLFICLQTVWLISHLGKLFIIIGCCQQCVQEGDRTLHLVQMLLANSVQESVKNTLTIFTMQLSQCKIEFNICGLFRIEKSPVSMAAAITTYLVVLLQITD